MQVRALQISTSNLIQMFVGNIKSFQFSDTDHTAN